MILVLKSGLLCVFTFTLPLSFSSPSLGPLFLCPLPLSGDGDEEHALLSHRVCQEWRDLRWVIFSSTRSVWPQYIKTLFHPVHSVAHKNLHCCVINIFVKQGSIKVLLSLRCLYSYTRPKSQRSHDWWKYENNILMKPLSCAASNCCAKYADSISMSSLNDITDRPVKAIEGIFKEKKINLLLYVLQNHLPLAGLLLTSSDYVRYQDNFLHACEHQCHWPSHGNSIVNIGC